MKQILIFKNKIMGNSPETKSNPEVLKVQESKKNLDEINGKL